VFVTGGTGYIGRPLIAALLDVVESPPPTGVRIIEVPEIRSWEDRLRGHEGQLRRYEDQPRRHENTKTDVPS
jgi:nucleoside-diphosphate-sugar epimerase